MITREKILDSYQEFCLSHLKDISSDESSIIQDIKDVRRRSACEGNTLFMHCPYFGKLKYPLVYSICISEKEKGKFIINDLANTFNKFESKRNKKENFKELVDSNFLMIKMNNSLEIEFINIEKVGEVLFYYLEAINNIESKF